MKAKAGGALIVICILLFFLSALSVICLKNSTLFHSFALDRYHQVRQQMARDSLVYYAIAYTKKSVSAWKKSFAKWPPHPSAIYSGSITVTKNADQYRITCSLFDQKKLLAKTVVVLTMRGTTWEESVWQSHWQNTAIPV